MARRRVLEDWRYKCWMKDYQFCSWGPAGVLSDLMVSKLASSDKIETIDDLLEAASDWGYVKKYGHDVLPLLKAADEEEQRKSQAQRVETLRANKKRKLEDLEKDERQRDTGGSTRRAGEPSGPSHTPLALTRTRLIDPVIVKQVPRPRPRPTLISHPYTRTDVFDSIANNSRSL